MQFQLNSFNLKQLCLLALNIRRLNEKKENCAKFFNKVRIKHEITFISMVIELRKKNTTTTTIIIII